MPNLKLGPAAVSIMVVVAFMAVVMLLILHPIDFSEKVATILNVLLGTLSAKFGDVVAYHIGSSAGSQSKDELLLKATPPK
jgi:TRAP-type C4-dicarboxylate transport system permease small subunit